MSETRLQELEEKLAYLEMTNTELSEEIFRQQKEIDALTKAHHNIVERVEQLQDSAAEQSAGMGSSGMGQGEKPPHY
ncbi:SlyX family protein [Porticoccaceae bacterium]|jgi:SlyX protein|nr:SlyX family protein [Porticoccaceae bacterium]